MTLSDLRRYDVGRSRPGSEAAARYPDQDRVGWRRGPDAAGAAHGAERGARPAPDDLRRDQDRSARGARRGAGAERWSSTPCCAISPPPTTRAGQDHRVRLAGAAPGARSRAGAADRSPDHHHAADARSGPGSIAVGRRLRSARPRRLGPGGDQGARRHRMVAVLHRRHRSAWPRRGGSACWSGRGGCPMAVISAAWPSLASTAPPSRARTGASAPGTPACASRRTPCGLPWRPRWRRPCGCCRPRSAAAAPCRCSPATSPCRASAAAA